MEIPGSKGVRYLTGRFVPYIAVAVFTVSSLLLLVKRTIENKSEISSKKVSVALDDIEGEKDSNHDIGISMADMIKGSVATVFFVLYCFSMVYLGHIVPSVLVAGVVGRLLGNKNKLSLVVTSVAIPIIINLVFTKAFQVPLPRGYFGLHF